jgi:hypothetical protein
MNLFDYPAIPLSFVAGPAILANVCAILQNGVNIRHAHAVDQWRNLQSMAVGQSDKLVGLYADPALAISLSGRRVRLQLRAIELLTVGTCSFGVTSLLSLGWSMLAQAEAGTSIAVASAATLACAAIGLLLLMTVALTVVRESACARALMRLHAGAAPPTTSLPGDRS